jgi:Fe-S-cluster-containing dehydrogenase component
MKMNRRDFMKAVITIGGSSLIGISGKAFAKEDFSDQPNRCGVLTDLTLCVGCRACEAACNDVNKLPDPKISFDDQSVFKEERRPDWRAYTVVNQYPNSKEKETPVFRKVQCFHCNEPACASACLVGAIKKTPEGAVLYDESVCIGCRYCMAACPFSIPAYDYYSATSPKLVKCTMCYKRISRGEAPACVEACSEKVHTFGKRKELIRLGRERIIKNPDKYVDHIYGEHEAGGTSWMYISGVPFEQAGFPTNIPNVPYLTFTSGFLGAVPLVLTLWPALLGGFYIFTKSHEQKGELEAQKSEKGRKS